MSTGGLCWTLTDFCDELKRSMPLLNSPFALLCLAVAIVLGGGDARGQYMIQLNLDKKTFLSQEPMKATVAISNNSGTDVVMGGRGNSNWLQFHLEDATGRTFPPVGVEVEESFVFKAGATMQRTVLISDTHSVADVGAYSARAVIYHAPTQDYYQSNRVRFDVTEVKPFWERAFGVPDGDPQAGRVRRYSLHILRDEAGSKLYFRLTDDRSGLRLATFSLGPVSLQLDPTFTLDSQNRMQAFFLAAPQIFAHVILGTDGKVVSRQYYRETDGNRPVLASKAGELFVAGGTPFDPAAPPPTSPAAAGRRASDRPPGL